jgi:hypothetical protein
VLSFSRGYWLPSACSPQELSDYAPAECRFRGKRIVAGAYAATPPTRVPGDFPADMACVGEAIAPETVVRLLRRDGSSALFHQLCRWSVTRLPLAVDGREGQSRR